MKKVFLVAACFVLVISVAAQTVKNKLQTAYQQFESDSQLKHAISSLYIVNERTGEIVFDKNSQIGLAPASTQKIITATTAFELLGKDYKYKTEVGYKGNIVGGILSPPTTSRAEEAGYAELVNGAKLGVPMNHSGIAVSRSYLKDHADSVKNFLAGYQEGWTFAADTANKSGVASG